VRTKNSFVPRKFLMTPGPAMALRIQARQIERAILPMVGRADAP
jgi:hypothetical protein